MSDSSIPPKPPTPPVTALAGNALPKDGTQRLLDEAAPVKQVPADIANGRLPLHLDGKVVSQNRETGETRIATTRGELVITTPKQLQKGTEVGIDISRTRENGLTARVTLPRETATPREWAELPPPVPQRPSAPPLKPGDSVPALVIEEESPAPPAAPAPDRTAALQKAAAIIERMSPGELAKLPQPLPVPPRVVAELAAAPDKLAALLRLPPAQQQAIIEYLTRPDVPAKLPQLAPPAPSGVPDARAPEIPPLPLPAASGKNAAPPPNVGAMRNLMPLLESLQQPAKDGPLMPRSAGQGEMPKGLQGLLPAMHQLRIVSITPPGETPPAPQPGQRLGVVEFLTNNGQPSIRAGYDSLLLKQAASVEVGSHIVFETSPMSARQVMAAFPAPTVLPPGFTPLLATTWPALQEAADALAA
ncbi:MAG TPA: hypothetical protein VEF76_10930, partial [Patescibacteria group bacterium]|nr:hypothetical protein [Patescibacteria group bacterium]